MGIPEEQLSILFDAYTRISKEGTAGERGTGLGLSISKTLVDKHHGSITVRSIQGNGSTFTVTLPLASESAIGRKADTLAEEKAKFRAKFKAKVDAKIKAESSEEVKKMPYAGN